jgi:vancomycin resistance protein YoaR
MPPQRRTPRHLERRDTKEQGMTWETKEPRSRARSGSSQPQGWNDPGWWDEAPKPAPKPTTSVRAASAPPLRRAASTPAATASSSSASAARATTSAGKPGFLGGLETLVSGLLAAAKSRSRGSRRARSVGGPTPLQLALGFGLGVFGALFLASAAVYGLSHAYDGKIMPGVHASDVDLSGLTHDEAVVKLDDAYAYLSQGKVTITTPGGTGTITYQDAGRAPDSEAMADAAMSIGRGGDPVSGAALALKTFTGGADIPVIVKLDTLKLETRLHELTGASLDPAKDYSVAIEGNDYQILDGAPGRGIDEDTIARQLIDQLADPRAASSLSIGGKFVSIPPSVSAADAQAAIDAANKMTADMTLALQDKTWTVPAATVHSWIIFGLRTDGKYGPIINPAPVATFINGLSKEVNVNPVEPKVTYGSNGSPTGIQGGTAGRTLNVDVSAQNVEAYLDSVATGADPSSAPIQLVVDDKAPTLNVDTLKGFVIIGQVATTYYPGESNGYGVNIALPAKLLNGQVIGPGEHFSLLKAVGPIDAAHGWKPGGVIKNGASQHTGAMGGGICSASTTMFQAAAVAGLQVDERHAHFYWISRYALDGRDGLDATVYSNGVTTWDLRLTNDTPYPIVIRAWTSGHSTSAIHVQLWSLPTGRKTTFTGGSPKVKGDIWNYDAATWRSPQYGLASLPGGAKSYAAEYPTAGFDTKVTRTVTDSTGAVIHQDTWSSHYTRVDGLMQYVGAKPTPTPTPGPPTPTPKPTATPPPASPSESTAPRRRLLRKPRPA